MKIRCFLLLFLVLNARLLTGQSYYFQQYSVGEGLPQSQVYALLQDSRGYLWLGTQGGGLARFDGKKFKNFTTSTGLSGNYVQAIFEDKDGRIWIGTGQGLSCYDGRSFKNFDLEKNAPVPVYGITSAGQPGSSQPPVSLWLATHTGIYGMVRDSIFKIATVEGQPLGKMNAACTDRHGNIWMGGDEGIYKLENGQWRQVWRRKAEVLSIIEAENGDILAGVFHLGVLRFDGQRWSILNKYQGLPDNRVQSIWQAPDRRIWVGMQADGVMLLTLGEGGKWAGFTPLTTNEGLCNNNVRTIAGDIWGNVWLGTSGSGACKFGGQEFEHFSTENGLRSNFVYSLCPGNPLPDSGTAQVTRLWLSAGDRGISYFDGEKFSHYDAANNFVDVKCRAMLQDSRGRLWVGTEGNGVAVSSPMDTLSRRFRFFTKNQGLAGNWIRDIAEGPDGSIWVATTDGGISKITVNDLASGSLGFKNFGQDEGLPDLTIHALHFDRQGRLWFATQRQGIGFFKNEVQKSKNEKQAGSSEVVLFGPENGLPSAIVRCLAEDTLGYLWVGTAGKGIGRAAIYNHGNDPIAFQILGQNDGLTSANVYLLQFDPQGRLWIGSENGVDKISLDAGRNLTAVQHYGKAEGFRGIETCQNAVMPDDRGNLWFGTVNGLTRYRPASDSVSAVPPKLHFTGVRLFYELLENTPFSEFATPERGLRSGAVFPHNKNHLGFEFFALNFSNPDKVAYSWQLVGSEDDWSPFSSRNEVSYANLPPGSYTFRVRAVSDFGGATGPSEIRPPTTEIEAVSFVIEPPFWATWWFRLSALAMLIAALGGFFRWRIRQVQRKAAQERAQLELKNHILTLEQKARQLQMNPHFIFNALNSIQSLVSAGNVDSARQYILKFGRLMRAVLDNSRQSLIPLEKEVETLRQYLEMEQFCRDGRFDFDILAEGISSDDLQIPPMLLQPFVENAILHGLGPLSERKGRVEVAFFEKDNLLEVLIRDNGIGIEQSQARKTGQEDRRSAGISVTRERLELLKKDAGFMAPAVEMHQLSGADGEVEGTEVRVRLPVQ